MPRARRKVQIPGSIETPKPTEALETAAAVAPSSKVIRASDVDPELIDRPVLTADGWVCPIKANPNNPQK